MLEHVSIVTPPTDHTYISTYSPDFFLLSEYKSTSKVGGVVYSGEHGNVFFSKNFCVVSLSSTKKKFIFSAIFLISGQSDHVCRVFYIIITNYWGGGGNHHNYTDKAFNKDLCVL